MACLLHLIRISGHEVGPAAAPRSLAIHASNISAARIRRSGASIDDDFGHLMLKVSSSLEPTWWADRASYMTLKQSGSIEGGPDLPELWDKEMDGFIERYYPSDMRETGQ